MRSNQRPGAIRSAGGRLRVLTVMGTRPEVIKLAPLVRAIAERTDRFEQRLCATVQHRELLRQALGDCGLEPDFDLDVMRPDQDLVGLAARTLARVAETIDEVRPDVVIVQGDTTSAAAAALAANYRRIPVAHVEAGLRTHDPESPFPEETNRVVIDRLAALLFAPTETAARNLIDEGLPREQIHVTGNTGIDALLATIGSQRPLERRDGSIRMLVTCHRRESFGAGVRGVCDALRRLVAAFPELRVTFVIHPNPAAGAAARRELATAPRIDLVEPLGYAELVAALRACDLLMTDSGGLQEEAPYVGTPVLVLRERTERVEGLEAGVAKLVGTDRHAVYREAARLIRDPDLRARMSNVQPLYGDGAAADRIVDILIGWAGLESEGGAPQGTGRRVRA